MLLSFDYIDCMKSNKERFIYNNQNKTLFQKKAWILSV